MADDEATARPTTKATGTPARKAPVRKAASARAEAAKKQGARKAPVAKASARKTPSQGAPATKQAGRAGAVPPGQQKKASRLRLAAEDTFADDWREPEAQPDREDPAARIRAILRAAAASLETREEAEPRAPTPTPPQTPPTPHVEAEAEVAEQADVEEVQEEQDEWSPPEVLEEVAPPPAPPPSPQPPAPSPPPTAPDPMDVLTTPEAPRPPIPPPGKKKRAGDGAGSSVLAIVLALLVPVVGAIVGFVIANRGRRRGAALAGVARVVSVLALVGWLIGAGVGAFNVFGDQGVDYSKLKVGDCFDSSATNEVRGVKVKPCSEPHNSEIFFLVTHPAGPDEPYPGKDALVQFAADSCLGQPLTDYLGVPLEQSKLKDFEIVPQESAWNDGRRVLVCGLDTGGEGQITGSVQGSRR